MTDLSAAPSIPAEPAAPAVLAVATPPAANADWKVTDAAALQKARGLLRYVDAILFSLDEPIEGGRVQAAATLLERAIEALTRAVDPGFAGPAAEHAFWSSLAAQPLPAAWRAFSLETPEASVLEVRAVAWAGLARLEAPRRARTWQLAMRALKFAGAVALACAVVGGVVALVRSRPPAPGLLAGRPVNTSSKLGRDSGNPKLMFHTDLEFRPWAEWDLGQPTRLHEVVVSNRSDCCDERALPLVVEVSDDRTRWVEVARRTEAFGANAKISFNEISARYLRLRVDRESFLHLEFVEAH